MGDFDMNLLSASPIHKYNDFENIFSKNIVNIIRRFLKYLMIQRTNISYAIRIGMPIISIK